MKEFLLTITEEEVLILSQALGKMPYDSVFKFIGKLQQQISEQSQRNQE